MSRTPYLDLNIPDKSSKGFVVTDVFEPNFTKLDQEAERVNLRKMSTEDNIEELKRSNRYKLGDIVEVLGFYVKGDGAHHKRQKVDGTYTGEDSIDCVDGNKWKIVHNGEVNVSWFGAKGDGVTDDMESLKKAFSYNCKSLTSCSNKMYKILQGIDVTNKNNIDFNNSKIFIDSSVNSSYCILTIKCSDIVIKNITLEGNKREGWTDYKQDHLLRIWLENENINIVNSKFLNSTGDGVYHFDTGNPSNNVHYYNCLFDNNTRNGVSIIGGDNVSFKDCIFSNTKGSNPQVGLDIEPNSNSRGASHITVDNCIFKDNFSGSCWAYKATPYGDSIKLEDITFKNCVMDHVIYTQKVKNLKIENNTTLENDISRFGMLLRETNGLIVSKNNSRNVQFNTTINGIINDNTFYDKSIISLCENVEFVNNTVINKNNINNSGIVYNTVEFESKEFYGHSNKTVGFASAISNALTNKPFSGSGGKLEGGLELYKGDLTFSQLNAITLSSLPQNENILVSSITAIGRKAFIRYIYRETLGHSGCPENAGILDIFNGGNLVNSSGTGRYLIFYSFTGSIYINITSGDSWLGWKRVFNYSTSLQTSLDTPYYTLKMQQEGIYEDYIAYRDELHEYENSQTTDDTMLLPVLQEPEIPDSIKQFAEKYKLI